MSCLRPLWFVCNVYGCLRAYGCLQRVWLFAFAACMAVCDVYGVRRLWLFATFRACMAVCVTFMRRLGLFA